MEEMARRIKRITALARFSAGDQFSNHNIPESPFFRRGSISNHNIPGKDEPEHRKIGESFQHCDRTLPSL